MIDAITPETEKATYVILRAKVTLNDLATIGSVLIQYYREESLSMTIATYEKLHSFRAKDPKAHLDLLWKNHV